MSRFDGLEAGWTVLRRDGVIVLRFGTTLLSDRGLSARAFSYRCIPCRVWSGWAGGCVPLRLSPSPPNGHGLSWSFSGLLDHQRPYLAADNHPRTTLAELDNVYLALIKT
jgi:hypothetical protein